MGFGGTNPRGVRSGGVAYRTREVAGTAFWRNEPKISNSFNGLLVPRDNARNLIGVVRQSVAAPDHMQVRPDQHIVEAVDPVRRLAVEIEHRKRRADRGERLSQSRRIATRGKLQQRVAVLDA